MKEQKNKGHVEVADRLAANWACPFVKSHGRKVTVSGQRAVHRVLKDLVAALFPGCHMHDQVPAARLKAYVRGHIEQTAAVLAEQVEWALEYQCTFDKCGKCLDCRKKAREIVRNLIDAMPEIQATLQRDILAAYEGDPAAKSTMEVVLSYPGVYAIMVHRIAHVLYQQGVPLIPRIMSEYAHSNTGIDIHPGAKIGPGFFIDHGTGVVIGETCEIGSNVKLYQGVTLGALSFEKDEFGRLVKGIKRHPNVGDNVVIYAGATILGGKTTIGSGSEIGGNVWLTHSVPPHSKVYNQQPKPLIRSHGEHPSES